MLYIQINWIYRYNKYKQNLFCKSSQTEDWMQFSENDFDWLIKKNVFTARQKNRWKIIGVSFTKRLK